MNIFNTKTIQSRAVFMKNWEICFQIRILRVNNTYLTYIKDKLPAPGVLVFTTCFQYRKITFYMRTHTHVLLAQSTSGTAMDMSHFHSANLKSPGSDIFKRGVGGRVTVCQVGIVYS